MQTQAVAKSVPGSPAGIEVRSQTPFAVGVVLWRDETARVLATVVAKATYSLAQGTSEVVDPPDPIRQPDEYWGDLAPFKAAYEVFLVGHLYSKPAAGRIVIGELEKRIAPHANLDLRPGDNVPLVGLGPMSRSFPARDSLLRPQDREWLLDPVRRPRPHAFDPRYFCTAPADQRSAEALRADERLLLEGLHPTDACLDTHLAGITPTLRTVGRNRPLPAFVADTLYIDTDRQIATLAFRATIPLNNEKLVLDLIADGHRESARVEEATIELDKSAFSDAALMGAGTAELDRNAFIDAASTALPFAPTSESGRTLAPITDDGALPFRPSAPSSVAAPPTVAPASVAAPAAAASEPSLRPSSAPQSASARLSSAPRPPPPLPPPPLPPLVTPSVVAPPAKEPLAKADPVAAAAAALGQLRSLATKLPVSEERRAPEPPPMVQERVEEKDRFRKAFGAGNAQPVPQPVPQPAPLQPLTTASTPDQPPSGGLRAAFDAGASLGAARAASDAAAATSSEKRSANISAAPAERSSVTRRAIVDLLAFDASVPSRLRRSKTHAPLLVSDLAPRTAKKLDDPAGEQGAEDRARIDVLRILSCGTPLGTEEIHAAFDALLDDPHDFEIPLFLVEGEVKPTMDEVETLRVAADLAKPLAGNNKRVNAALSAANDALSRSAPPVSEAAATLYKQLEASTGDLSLPSRHLADQVDRTLREARSFKKRTLLGAPRIRADLMLGKGTLPIYLPDSAASQLPLLPVFPLAALVEFRPREDASEANPAALVAFAFGRVLRARK